MSELRLTEKDGAVTVDIQVKPRSSREAVGERAAGGWQGERGSGARIGGDIRSAAFGGVDRARGDRKEEDGAALGGDGGGRDASGARVGDQQSIHFPRFAEVCARDNLNHVELESRALRLGRTLVEAAQAVPDFESWQGTVFGTLAHVGFDVAFLKALPPHCAFAARGFDAEILNRARGRWATYSRAIPSFETPPSDVNSDFNRASIHAQRPELWLAWASALYSATNLEAY